MAGWIRLENWMNTLNEKCCQALNKNGDPCASSQYANSGYCYIHYLLARLEGKIFSKIPWWKTPAFHLIMFILSVVGTFLAIYHETHSASKTDVRLILQRMNIYAVSNKKVLTTTFPYGYVLFAIHEDTKTIWPASYDPLRYDYKVEWSKALILERNQDYIKLKLPSIVRHYKSRRETYYVYKKPIKKILGYTGPVMPTPWRQYIRKQMLRNGQIIDEKIDFLSEENTKDTIYCVDIGATWVKIPRNSEYEMTISLFEEDYQVSIAVLYEEKEVVYCVIGLQENTFQKLSEPYQIGNWLDLGDFYMYLGHESDIEIELKKLIKSKKVSSDASAIPYRRHW